ncbi:hypothetical protein PC129_g15525 [Phytophthora cactorum]|uniref:Uncharacterized protein n=2 Tax=Phytophthora cactorum TaxID=29920 RepID=A0A329R5I5_9STRA|nr:hypothetical protein Pcac1_g4932 [Phytophthora cactorum]KAG2816808.1 hypothetical protein PC111_g12988 [Phytophthora cactorum]KAG2858939.1 hypothetical protein PC113_g9385 [Phytophthora cactorum]KAG2909799.1 hypothetical protein PC114_g9999 [Phytophthora cactorum]KAG2956888.1 hypothetical protein PC119_g27522 [Phytophthora cactorum]
MVPLFTPMVPPTIPTISHEALVKWKRDRREYGDKLRARCRISGEDYDTVVEPVTNAFEPDLLDVFCDLKLRQASADVTEGMLIAEIEYIVTSVKNNTVV